MTKLIYIASPVGVPDEYEGCSCPGCLGMAFDRHGEMFKKAVRHVIRSGNIPLAPQWLAFGGYLDDDMPEEREQGIAVGEAYLEVINREGDSIIAHAMESGELAEEPELWVYGWATEPKGTLTEMFEVNRVGELTEHLYVSKGMAAEINYAQANRIPVRFVEPGEWEG